MESGRQYYVSIFFLFPIQFVLSLYGLHNLDSTRANINMRYVVLISLHCLQIKNSNLVILYCFFLSVITGFVDAVEAIKTVRVKNDSQTHLLKFTINNDVDRRVRVLIWGDQAVTHAADIIPMAVSSVSTL